MKLFHNIFTRLTLAMAGCVALAGCDGLIYDEEGDCDYRIRFVFDKHLHHSDAFAYEVNAVTLYLVDDATGRIVWQKPESGPELKSGHYRMTIPDDMIPAGNYSMIAWCGDGVGTHFSVADADHYAGLNCRLERQYDQSGRAFSDCNLNRLYHGRLDAVRLAPDVTVRDFTVPLTKDTNDVTILLQNLDGVPIEDGDFTFQIIDANGHMDWDNSIMPDEEIVYRPHHVSYGMAQPLDAPAARASVSMPVCFAEFSVGRMMADRDMRLVVLDAAGDTTANFPLINYALMVKGTNNLKYDDQDFLDRQDKFDLTLFMKNDRWQQVQLNILSWQLVIDHIDL
ncbi:MAG: FimB/Mfa2 family fimbrial subunit [Muribaculaceae bacterium]|nr:FimB/Mfa2 family fimbrial subunit [Muribaculaceae bacterium]